MRLKTPGEKPSNRGGKYMHSSEMNVLGTHLRHSKYVRVADVVRALGGWEEMG